MAEVKKITTVTEAPNLVVQVELEIHQITKDNSTPFKYVLELKPDEKAYLGRAALSQYQPSGEMSSKHLFFELEKKSLQKNEIKVLIQDNSSTNG